MDDQHVAAPIAQSNSNQASISQPASGATSTATSSIDTPNAGPEARGSDSKDISQSAQGGRRRDRPGKKRDMGRSEWS